MEPEFCVVCGRSDRPVVEGECTDCYVRGHTLLGVADHPVVVLCPTCGARKVGQHWEGSGRSSALSPDDLAPFLLPQPEVTIRSVRWVETGHHAAERELDGEARIRFRDEERTLPLRLQVHVDARTCPDCSRRSGRYYTATIQLRSELGGPHEPARVTRERLAEAWDRVIGDARSEWRKALSFREERPEGWDLFLTDSEAAKALAHWMKHRLHASLNESASLWGRKDGREVYRVTFCLRVPKPGSTASKPPRRNAHRPSPALLERQS